MSGGTMRAAVLYGRDDLRIEPRPVPEPGPGEILVEVSHCGVCGSDLHMVMDGWGRPGSIGGHEWSGRVAALGPETARLSVGDAVVGGPTPGCGSCPACLRQLRLDLVDRLCDRLAQDVGAPTDVSGRGRVRDLHRLLRLRRRRGEGEDVVCP